MQLVPGMGGLGVFGIPVVSVKESKGRVRAVFKKRRLAREIADLKGKENILNEAIWEAIIMRRSKSAISKKGW